MVGMYFVKEYEVEPNKLLAMTFEPRLEQTLISRVKRSQFDIGLVMDPSLTEGIINDIEPKIKEMTERGLSPIIVTTTELRLAFRRFMEPHILNSLSSLTKSYLQKLKLSHSVQSLLKINPYLRILYLQWKNLLIMRIQKN